MWVCVRVRVGCVLFELRLIQCKTWSEKKTVHNSCHAVYVRAPRPQELLSVPHSFTIRLPQPNAPNPDPGDYGGGYEDLTPQNCLNKQKYVLRMFNSN